jgi:hypothetical protein
MQVPSVTGKVDPFNFRLIIDKDMEFEWEICFADLGSWTFKTYTFDIF